MAKEHELLSLGGQAAAAAHSLGTPLSTIKLITQELSKQLKGNKEIEKDIELRNRLSQKADDMEVLYDFLSNNQVSESEFQIELEIFSKLIKEFELKLILN